MATKTTAPDPVGAVKGGSMAQGTRILDIGCRVMERVIRAGPVNRIVWAPAPIVREPGEANTSPNMLYIG